MSDEESFGIMPYHEMNELKNEVKKLKEKDSSDQVLSSVAGLTKGIDSMLQLFKSAVDEMKSEDQEDKNSSTQLGPIIERLDEIIEQNKIIAEGMVALSDLVKERIPDKIRMMAPPPLSMNPQPFSQQPMGPPPMAPPMGPPPGPNPAFPPPWQNMQPPEPPRRKGFFK